MTLPTAAPGQCIEMAAVPNLRDVGGYETRDGRCVRTGRLYRSTELDKLAGDDVATFARLGIRTVYDMRTKDPALLRPVIGVQPEYLESALDEMRRRFGTIEGYFTRGLGLDPGVQHDLGSAFLERS